MMRRIPDVLDCWFESGSMPYAQVHYPFENREWFEEPLPGGLHRRVRGPDPRLVLHDDGAVDGALRPAALPELHLPRRGPRRGRQEALEAPAQLPGARGRLRHPRLRRVALVPGLLAAAQGRRPEGRARRQAHRRRGAQRPESDLERLVLLLALRERRRHRGQGDEGGPGRPRPLRAGQDPRAGRSQHGLHGRLRHRGRLRTRSSPSSTRSTTGTSAAAGRASGRARHDADKQATPTTRSTPRSPRPAGWRPRCCRS